MDTYTSITIRYTATDAAGNIAYCKFNITLEGTQSLAHEYNVDVFSIFPKIKGAFPPTISAKTLEHCVLDGVYIVVSPSLLSNVIAKLQ